MSIPADIFFLDPARAGTLQQQLRLQVMQAVLCGRIRPGEKMPSSRRLAEHLGISRITVALAYTELVATDYLTARGRSGHYVSATAPREAEAPAGGPARGGNPAWVQGLARYSSYGQTSRPADWRRFTYPFIYGQADPGLFDHAAWRQCGFQALGQRDFEALTADRYETDDPMLVDAIIRHILPRRGIHAQPDEILLTLGAQNALWLSAQVLLTQRRTAVIENPGYPQLRAILGQTRCRTLAVDVDAEGLPPEALPEDTDVLFVTPSHQCPTNVTMPLARRHRLLALAAARGFAVVEDDYEFELSFDGAPAPALKSLDHDGTVIHIGSFSKSLFPGLRLGFLVGHPAFIREARALRALVLRHPPGHLQRTLAYFLAQGHYDTQLARMRATYAQRRRVMAEALRLHGLAPAAGMAAIDGRGGSSFWMRTPAGIDSAELALALRAREVLIEPGQAFFAGEAAATRYYRLAYSSIPESRIPEGIARIARAITAARPQPVPA